MEQESYQGAVDSRTAEQKKSDFHLSEIANGSSVPVFEERAPVSYTVRNQDGSGSCVAQTTAKMLEIWDKKNDGIASVYSATPIYQSRMSKPQPGMNYIDALSHPIKKGTFLESDVPSQNMNDTQMDQETLDGVSQTTKPTNYVTVPTDFYAVASQVKEKGAVMVWFKCSYQEWCRDVPEGTSDSEAVRHSVTAVDIISHDGVEYIIIEDSWGTWLQSSEVPLKAGQRAITKKFFDKHCFFAGMFTAFEYGGGNKPGYFFQRNWKFGETDVEIKMLQLMLQHEKFFPSNIETTKYFGAITARALKAWQISHDILDFANEVDVTKIRFGNKSRELANKLYANDNSNI